MKIKLSAYASQHTIHEQVYKDNFQIKEDIEEMEKQIQTHNYQIKLKEKWFDGVHISRVEIANQGVEDFLYESSAHHIGFLFCIDGKISFNKSTNTGYLLNIAKNQYYVLSGRLEPLVIRAVKKACYVYVQLTTSYFQNLTNQELKDHQMIQQHLLTPEVGLWLNRLESYSYQGRIERIFLESRMFELIIFYLQKKEPAAVPIKEDDLMKIMFAKQLVENNLQRPGSLIELSRRAGINDFKLKKGFKILTGYTVFGYLYKLRMEKAQHLLLQEKKTVNEVAFLVGYKNAQHFITAFKRQYGISPGSLNKNNLIQIDE